MGMPLWVKLLIISVVLSGAFAVFQGNRLRALDGLVAGFVPLHNDRALRQYRGRSKFLHRVVEFARITPLSRRCPFPLV